jgi:oligosaccharide repeat unit polymerase
MIFGGCMAVFVYMLVRRPGIGWMILMVTGTVAVIAILFIAVNISPSALWELGSNTEITNRLFLIVRGYVYNNYINLDLEFAYRDTYTYGKYTFFFVSKLLDPNLVGYADTTDFIVLDSSFNMGTFLREYFVDFGMPGALLVPFVLGVLTALVANSWRNHAMPRHAIALAVLLTACLFAFFGNQFVRLQFLYVIFMAYAADLIASELGRRRRVRQDRATLRQHECAA